MLHDLRESKGLTQQGLADKIKVAKYQLSWWETGRVKIDFIKLGELGSVFTEREAKHLVLLVRPEIIAHVGEAWLTSQIEQQRWRNISLPALDKTWLNAQPTQARAGLLLRDLLASKQITAAQLARRVGVSPTTVGGWGNGSLPISYTKLGEIECDIHPIASVGSANRLRGKFAV